MTCSKCHKEFEKYKAFIICTWGCDDGIYESDRDYGIVTETCRGCRGTGEQEISPDVCRMCWEEDNGESF